VTSFADLGPPLAGPIARRPTGRQGRVAVAMAIALLLFLAAPVAANADHITPGYQPAEVNGKTVPPRWGTPGPDRLGGSSADHCSGKEQAGTRNLLRYLEYWWPRGESWGIYNCRLPSLHSEGRAVDFHLDVRSTRDRNAGYAISRFFRSKDSGGARWAMARRFEIQEIIFDCKIWTSARAREGWRRYSVCDQAGASRTAEHKDHIHIGQSWRGATRRTTAWTGFHYCYQCAMASTASRGAGDPSFPDPVEEPLPRER
jgi:hypothetical protein